MPSDQSTWIISVPQDSDSDGLLEELGSKISQQTKAFTPNNIGQLPIPSFKVIPAHCRPHIPLYSRDNRLGPSIPSSLSRRNYRNTMPISHLLSLRSSKRSVTF